MRGVLQSLSALYNSFYSKNTYFSRVIPVSYCYFFISHILSVVNLTKSVKCIAKSLKTGDNGTPSSELLNSVTLGY